MYYHKYTNFLQIYGLKCVEYKLPNIELEITCINETESYLAELGSIHYKYLTCQTKPL